MGYAIDWSDLEQRIQDQKAALLGLAGRYAVLAGPRTEEEGV